MRNASVSGLVQKDFWGEVADEAKDNSPAVISAVFSSNTIRMIVIKGEPWWVASDVCRVLGISNTGDAIADLDEDEKNTIAIADSIRGNPNRSTINESGLFALIFRSRKPEARRFRKWVTSEVLPQIRRTGSYVPPNNRIIREAKRLKCNTSTAEARCDQFTANKSWNRELADSGAKPRDFQAIHNAIYRGQFDAKCSAIRAALGIKPWQTPLDFMGYLPLMANGHIKAIVGERIRDLGPNVPITAKVAVAYEIARDMTADDLRRLGPGYIIGANDHPKRGLIIDVKRNEIARSEMKSIAS